MYPLDSSSDSNDEELIEMARATIPMSEVVCLPEKVGQLVAGLHFIALAKITRNLMSIRDLLLKGVTVKGILVNKVKGIIECKLTVMASTATAIVPIEVSCVDQNGQLSATLCVNQFRTFAISNW